MIYNFAQLAEEVTVTMLRTSDRKHARNVFFRDRDIFGRAYGLPKPDAEEVGFHGVAIVVEQMCKAEIVLHRDGKGQVTGWDHRPLGEVK